MTLWHKMRRERGGSGNVNIHMGLGEDEQRRWRWRLTRRYRQQHREEASTTEDVTTQSIHQLNCVDDDVVQQRVQPGSPVTTSTSSASGGGAPVTHPGRGVSNPVPPSSTFCASSGVVADAALSHPRPHRDRDTPRSSTRSFLASSVSVASSSPSSSRSRFRKHIHRLRSSAEPTSATRAVNNTDTPGSTAQIARTSSSVALSIASSQLSSVPRLPKSNATEASASVSLCDSVDGGTSNNSAVVSHPDTNVDTKEGPKKRGDRPRTGLSFRSPTLTISQRHANKQGRSAALPRVYSWTGGKHPSHAPRARSCSRLPSALFRPSPNHLASAANPPVVIVEEKTAAPSLSSSPSLSPQKEERKVKQNQPFAPTSIGQRSLANASRQKSSLRTRSLPRVYSWTSGRDQRRFQSKLEASSADACAAGKHAKPTVEPSAAGLRKEERQHQSRLSIMGSHRQQSSTDGEAVRTPTTTRRRLPRVYSWTSGPCHRYDSNDSQKPERLATSESLDVPSHYVPAQSWGRQRSYFSLRQIQARYSASHKKRGSRGCSWTDPVDENLQNTVQDHPVAGQARVAGRSQLSSVMFPGEALRHSASPSEASSIAGSARSGSSGRAQAMASVTALLDSQVPVHRMYSWTSSAGSGSSSPRRMSSLASADRPNGRRALRVTFVDPPSSENAKSEFRKANDDNDNGGSVSLRKPECDVQKQSTTRSAGSSPTRTSRRLSAPAKSLSSSSPLQSSPLSPVLLSSSGRSSSTLRPDRVRSAYPLASPRTRSHVSQLRTAESGGRSSSVQVRKAGVVSGKAVSRTQSWKDRGAEQKYDGKTDEEFSVLGRTTSLRSDSLTSVGSIDSAVSVENGDGNDIGRSSSTEVKTKQKQPRMHSWHDGVSTSRAAVDSIVGTGGLASSAAARRAYDEGVRYDRGAPEERNVWRAATLYKRAADAGDIRAQCDLGSCFEKGRGVERDVTRAVALYKSAAACGLPRAEFHLARCHAHGIGVPRDAVRAVRLYRSAARGGHIAATCNLAVCYQTGVGVNRNEVRAVALYRQASAEGYARALYNLGVCYESGVGGLTKDCVQAAKLYRKACKSRFPAALCAMGVCYEHGVGVDRDLCRAVKYYRRAAQGGYARAHFCLGVCFANAKGVDASKEEALACFRRAVDGGFGDAASFIATLDRHHGDSGGGVGGVDVINASLCGNVE